MKYGLITAACIAAMTMTTAQANSTQAKQYTAKASTQYVSVR